MTSLSSSMLGWFIANQALWPHLLGYKIYRVGILASSVVQ